MALIGSSFILGMVGVIGALIFVILDINQSLAALKLERIVEVRSFDRSIEN